MPRLWRTSRGLRAVVAAGLVATLTGCTGPTAPFDTGPLGPSATTTSTAAPTTGASTAGSAPTTSPTTTTTRSSTAPSSSSTASPSSPSDDAPKAKELPGGGRTLFPRYRLVGYAGRTGSTALGRLGIGDVDQRMTELERRAKPYAADGRRIMPVMELIATTVQAGPGRDGQYRTRMGDSQVKHYLDVARKHDALLLLAIQPGRADFLPEVKAYDRWLAEPDVGIALDPEWAIGPGQVPGRTFGHTTGGELDEVAAHLSSVAAQHDLPDKVMVFHELAARIVTDESRLHPHRGVVVIKSVDGIGSPAAKRNTYRVVNQDTPKGVQPGFKLFYEEDRDTSGTLMSPASVMALKPRPAYVMYE